LLAYTAMAQGGIVLGGLAAACAEQVRPEATPWIDAEISGAVGSTYLCLGIDSLAQFEEMAGLGPRFAFFV
jgi:hypothetical protein